MVANQFILFFVDWLATVITVANQFILFFVNWLATVITVANQFILFCVNWLATIVKRPLVLSEITFSIALS